MADSNGFNDFVTCPYNKAHKLIRGRLAKHLERCSRSSGNLVGKLLVCPFNKTHRFNEEELNAHIKVCPDSATLNAFRESKAPSPSKIVPRQDLVHCEEDWDKEPDAPTYHPNPYCENNPIIRTSGLKGKSKAKRLEFRQNERRRFADAQ